MLACCRRSNGNWESGLEGEVDARRSCCSLPPRLGKLFVDVRVGVTSRNATAAEAILQSVLHEAALRGRKLRSSQMNGIWDVDGGVGGVAVVTTRSKKLMNECPFMDSCASERGARLPRLLRALA